MFDIKEEINDYNPNEDSKPMATIITYRANNNLNKKEFCERFGFHKQHYNTTFRDSRQWMVIQSRKVDQLIEVKAEYIK